MVDAFGFERDLIGFDHQVFGKSAILRWEGPSINFIANAEMAYFIASLLDYAGYIPADGQRKFRRELLLCFASHDLLVDRVDAAGVHFDQYFIFDRLRHFD